MMSGGILICRKYIIYPSEYVIVNFDKSAVIITD